MKTAYLGLGANLGDRIGNIAKAVRLLAKTEGVDVAAISPFYETLPEFWLEQPDFINCAVSVVTRLSPFDLLKAVKTIESAAGRKKSFRYGPRAVDVDILLYGSDIISSEELSVPHEGLAGRRFVLFPLVAIAPEAVDPRSGRSVAEMLSLRLSEPGANPGEENG